MASYEVELLVEQKFSTYVFLDIATPEYSGVDGRILLH